ncbi:MFS transporter [Gulosibacter molinativorax]|uniref:MFS transporter n=1 Tax=Gulosibacter molinativorax TaxID=256821 RepID=A0ABT7CD51_9MICO|nr:aromatic acid/H+ symport family MFS transporter [Gulosibacter molinativorax]MDJ1372629.1 MFS transporter [Gulosibacter molinativorax]QUY62587.1 Gentisate transporter [Gulosibacter molinativorax]
MSKTMARSSWATVFVCAFIIVAEGYDLIVYGTLIPSLLEEPGWNLDKSGAGNIGSMVYVGMLIGALLSGRLSDRFGRKKLILVSITIFLIFTAACALAFDPVSLGVFRLMAGIGMGGVMPSCLALVKESIPEGRTSLAVTILMAGVPLGGTAASLLGLVIIESYGWRPMFWIGVVLSALILVLATTLLKESTEFTTRQIEIMQGKIVERPGFGAMFSRVLIAATILFALAAFANLMTWYGLNTWLTTIMADFNYPLESALQFSLTLNGGAVIGSFAFAVLADRFGSLKLAMVSGIVVAGALVLFAVGTDQLLVLLVLIAAIGMGAHSGLNLINASVADFYPLELRATALGWSNGIGRAGAIVAPSLGGFVFSTSAGGLGVIWTFTISALLSVVFVGALLIMARRKNSDSDVDTTVVEAQNA